MNRRIVILLMVGALLLLGADSFAQGEPRPAVGPVVAQVVNIEVNGVLVAAEVFLDVGPSEASVVETQDGNSLITRKTPGRNSGGDLTLYRPLTDNTYFTDWWRKIVNGKGARRNLTVIFLDDQFQEVTRWCYYWTWPYQYELISWDRLIATDGAIDYLGGGDTVYERVQLVTEKFIPNC